MPEVLRVGFVTGTTPDKWARAWRERRRERLELVPVEEGEQEALLRRGEVDMCLVRLPIEIDDLHRVQLYDEVPVVVAGGDHLVAATVEVMLHDLEEEQLVRPHTSGWRPSIDQLPWPAMTEGEAIATVAAGVGIVIVPMSVARLHRRKDTVQRPVTDLPPTTIALVWLRSRDDEVCQDFVGVVRGRTSRSSRG